MEYHMYLYKTKSFFSKVRAVVPKTGTNLACSKDFLWKIGVKLLLGAVGKTSCFFMRERFPFVHFDD